MDRYLVVHGHFYQPPRENPWLEAIELQDSAYPYHDWNERVNAECYSTNASSRILDGRGRIVEIVNNYSRISYNFGPTLLAWLEEKDPDTYAAIVDADSESARTFGRGSAMAQPYNHMIMPLASPRDQRTQLVWGLRDFERRFGRTAEGVWLPETAVDLRTLELLAEQGIRFTVLAPHQAARTRAPGAKEWVDVSGARIDPRHPYVQNLPSGRSIAIFFYDGPASRAIAFEGLLRNGERFAHRLTGLFHGEARNAQLVHVATDGETYGHHHRHGEMALAYALRWIDTHGAAKLTNYAAFLERFPPAHEVEIVEDTAWSCAHGVERWRSDCGCSTGGQPGWHQRWRAPLRAALDWLRDRLEPEYERLAGELLHDPWAARDDYIEVILDRSDASVDAFFARHGRNSLGPAERVRALELLEMQRHAMLMFTSCGWFFNDLAGIETVQVLQYAGRAVQLATRLVSDDIEAQFLQRLEEAQSNLPTQGNGRQIFERYVRPAIVDLRKVGAHFAVNSLFDPQLEQKRTYCYLVETLRYDSYDAARARLALGQVRVSSRITHETSPVLSFGVLHLGDHNLNGGIGELKDEGYAGIREEASRAFERADLPTVIRILDRFFPTSTYSIKSLFGEEQRRVLDRILDTTLVEAESVYRRLYERHAPLMRFLADLDQPLPSAFQMAAEFYLNTSLIRVFSEDDLDLERASVLLEEARTSGVELDASGLSYALGETLRWLAEWVYQHPTDLPLLRKLDAVVGLAASLPFEVNLWKAQNIYYEMLRSVYPDFRERAEAGDAEARAWEETFLPLGEKLAVAV